MRILRPVQWNTQLAWRSLYARFVASGSLVFDVGANRGDRTESFLQLGAQVVAAEPNPDLASRLSTIYRRCPVTVVEAAVGENESRMPMYISSHTHVSSLSEDWIRNMKADRLKEINWSRQIMVQVTTVEELRRKFGEPDFVKIDVEGFERFVLRGIQHKIRALSFEVHAADMDHAAECIELLTRLGEYRFNFLLEESPELVLENWISASELIGTLKRCFEGGSAGYGDVFAIEA